MDLEEIISKKKPGDLTVAGEILGITNSNAANAFNRPGSKYHERVTEILRAIIQNRDQLKNIEQA